MKESSEQTAHHKNVNASNPWTHEVDVSHNWCLKCWGNHSNTEKCYLFAIIVLLIALFLIIFIFILLSIRGDINFIKNNNNNNKSELCLSIECIRVSAIILERIDISVDPCDDFYQFSCGNFIRKNPVPDDHYLKNLLQEIQDEVYFEMKNYLEDYNSNQNDSRAVQQIKLLYNSCMNESHSNDQIKSIKALVTLFDQIGGQWPLISNEDNIKVDLEYRLSSLILYQVQPFFQLFIEPMQTNKSHYAIHLLSGTTFLESTYLLNSENTFELTEEISAYIELQTEVAKVFHNFSRGTDSELNFKTLRNDIIETIRLESDLSKITKDMANESNLTIINENIEEMSTNSDENLFNSTLIQNMFFNITTEEMEEKYKSIKWKKLFKLLFNESKVEKNEIMINSREYLTQLIKLIDSYSPKTIDNYLSWTFIARYLPYLGPQFRRIYSEFRTKVPDMSAETGDPSGSSRIFLSRWKECVHVVSEGMDVPAIVLYLQYKSQILDSMVDKINKLIKQIKSAFNLIVDSQQWLDSQEMKTNFKNRVNNIQSKIGVPKFLTNKTQVDKLYEELEIDPDDLLITNIFKMTRHQVLIEFKKLNRMADVEEEWIIQPLIANAYYDPINNNIIMPPGILRFPLISLDRPEYLDFATLGIVIGHEIAHSMGSDSRKFMRYSNGSNWWTPEVNKIFKEKAKCFAQQYSQYSVESTDEYLNGNHTLEENICDFAGLQQSYTAYELNKQINFLQLPGLSNYSTDQLFFIQYAQIWCEVVSYEGHRKSLHDDHSPGRYRANGVLVNSKQFSKAFKCPENCRMNPKDKCNLWEWDSVNV